MRRISLLLACLVLLAAAFAVDRAGSLGPIPSPLAAGSQSAGEVQVPPPQGARASANVLAPFETIGSPYLRTTVGTYRVPLTRSALYAYDQPLLQHLGYRSSGVGQTCGRTGYCTYGWAFARGTDMSDTVVLTVAPKAEGSLYSVALELIMAPPRPTGSFVPAGATQVTVRARATFSSVWRHATFTAPAVIGRLRRIVNGLPVDTGGRLGCAADVGASAMVTFTASIGSLSYLDNPACVTVAGPDGALLADLSWDLWRVAAQLTHVRVPSP